MEEKKANEAKRAVQRSPNYPAITLEKAIEKARIFWNYEKRNAANITVALNHWGYGPNSGGGRTLVGAMIGFGLLRDEGAGDKRQLKLSDVALRIILDDRPNSADRLTALRDAALTPKVYREILALWPGLDVSDANLKHYLLVDRKFNDKVVKDFIADFRSTIEFAKLNSEPDGGYESGKGDSLPEINIGDHVRWESGGVIQFEARRVTWVKEGYAGVEGTGSGLPFNELTVVPAPVGATRKEEPEPRIEVTPTRSSVGDLAHATPKKGIGMRQEVFTLIEGDVTIQWPERISVESFEDFTDWLRILERKIKRNIAPSSPQGQIPDDGSAQ